MGEGDGAGKGGGGEEEDMLSRRRFLLLFSSLTSLSKIVKCSYKSLAIFAKFIPNYFVSLVSSINRLFSHYIFKMLGVGIMENYRFCIVISLPVTLMNPIIVSNRFRGELLILGFPKRDEIIGK